MKTITICNQKGGCSKTTTSAAMAAGLARRGFHVLAVDADGQHSLTMICGTAAGPFTLADVIAGRATAAAAIRQTTQGFDILPGDMALFDDLPKSYRLTTLRGLLAAVARRYDYCIIDTGPNLSLLTMGALVAADTVVIPAAPDVMSLYGIQQAGETIEAIRAHNRGLRAGILLTQFNDRRNVDGIIRETIEEQAQAMGATVYRQTIRTGAAVSKTNLLQQDLFTSAPRAGVTADYNAFIDEFLRGA